MSRGLASAITTELAKGQFIMAHLVKIEENEDDTGTTFKYTDGSSNIVDGSDTYVANSFLLGLDSVTESSNISIGSLTLGFSAVDQTVISDVLTHGHLNRKVTIKRAFLDSSNTLISGAVFQVYSGRIEGMGIKDSGKNSVMELSVANHWADFKKTSGRMTNNTSQQHHFENDLSMEFAPQTGKKLLWGDIKNPASEADSSFAVSGGLSNWWGGFLGSG